VVKILPDGRAVLLCLFHTADAGLASPLPAERPSGWPGRREEPGSGLQAPGPGSGA
jgi:hypothetical protein